MDLNEIRRLVRLLEKSALVELEVEDSNAGVRVLLRKEGADGALASPPVVQYLAQGGGPPAALGAAPVPTAQGSAASASAGDALPPGTEPFKSPMVGTFYRSPSPDSDPFVGAGTKVDEDTVLCIIEAMKVMNEIKAEMKGEIVEVLVENGEPVEFGQPLFLVKKG